jgi:hypothetical protein
MPDSVIKRVETLGHCATAGAFEFSDRKGILFEWDKIDEHQEQLVEEEHIAYPSIVVELPGLSLERDMPIPTIEAEFEQQGHPENEAAHNANLLPFAAAGVNWGHNHEIVDYDNHEIADYDDEDDGGIIAVNEIQPPEHGDIINMIDIPQNDFNDQIDGHVDTNSDTDSDNDDDTSDTDSDDDDDAATAERDDDAVEDLDDASIPGVR